jgi:hypothetical protein
LGRGWRGWEEFDFDKVISEGMTGVGEPKLMSTISKRRAWARGVGWMGDIGSGGEACRTENGGMMDAAVIRRRSTSSYRGISCMSPLEIMEQSYKTFPKYRKAYFRYVAVILRLISRVTTTQK